MSKIDLGELNSIDGYLGSAMVDMDSGMLMAGDGSAVDLEIAAAGNSQVLKAKIKVAKDLKLDDKVEDVLITLGRQYHLLRPLESNDSIFLYLVLDRSRANLAMARHSLRSYEKGLDFC